jgi:HAMP domain-containing protein
MAQESLSLEVGMSPFSPAFRWQRMNLRRKIAGALIGIIASVGLLVVIIVYQFTGSALRRQLDQQASVIATNLSDAASGLIMGKNILELHALIAKYARLDGVAYVFIEDAKGEVLINSTGVLPPELRPLAASRERRQAGKISLTFDGRPVYETRVPILEGRAGVAHVGLWGDVAESEIRRLVRPIITLIGAAIVGGMILSSFLARWIIRPILALIAVADRISKGDLDTPVKVSAYDEIGELACSLERMRVSLRAAMARLSPA